MALKGRASPDEGLSRGPPPEDRLQGFANAMASTPQKHNMGSSFASRLTWHPETPSAADSPGGTGSRRLTRGGSRTSESSMRRSSIPQLPPQMAYSYNVEQEAEVMMHPDKRLSLGFLGNTAQVTTPKRMSLGNLQKTLSAPLPLKVEKPAIDELVRGETEFIAPSRLLNELRQVFDWICQEKGAMKIASRKFNQRLPELHKTMPHFATSFRRMDANGDCWLEWSEFLEFCVRDIHLMNQMHRTTVVSVYAREKSGEISYKEVLDPKRMCEIGSIPPLMPWELSHVVEWRIEDLLIGAKVGSPVTLGHPGSKPMRMRPGSHVASPPFRGAGVCGYLKFFPAGYWTEAQHRHIVANTALHVSADEKMTGPYPTPHPDAWCCVSLCLPAGTHLVFRFFIGDYKSEKRESFWHEGAHPGTLWAPVDFPRPVLGKEDSLVVGVEIFRNLSATNGYAVKQHKQRGTKDRTPYMRGFADVDPEEEMRKQPVGMTVAKSMSLPELPRANTWRNLERLISDHHANLEIDDNEGGMSQKVVDHSSAQLVQAVAHISDNSAKLPWKDNLMLRSIVTNLVTSIQLPPNHIIIKSMADAAREYHRVASHGFGVGSPEHFAFRGFVVGLTKAIQDKKDQALIVGDHVEVLEDIESHNEKVVKLPRGSEGIVMCVNGSGDAQIKFEGINALQLIYRDSFHLLELQAHHRLIDFAAKLKHADDFKDVVGTCFHRVSGEEDKKARIWIQFLSKANTVKEIAKKYFDRESDCEILAVVDDKNPKGGAAKKLQKSLVGVQDLMKKL